MILGSVRHAFLAVTLALSVGCGGAGEAANNDSVGAEDAFSTKKCSTNPLSDAKIQSLFVPGSATTKPFGAFYLSRRMRTCNTVSGCGPWRTGPSKVVAREWLGPDRVYTFDAEIVGADKKVIFDVGSYSPNRLSLIFHLSAKELDADHERLGQTMYCVSRDPNSPSALGVEVSCVAEGGFPFLTPDGQSLWLGGTISDDCLDVSTSFATPEDDTGSRTEYSLRYRGSF